MFRIPNENDRNFGVKVDTKPGILKIAKRRDRRFVITLHSSISFTIKAAFVKHVCGRLDTSRFFLLECYEERNLRYTNCG